MFYARSDRFTGNNPENCTSGFGNTKCVIAFYTKKDREKWLKETRLMTAVAITRKQALQEIKWNGDTQYTKNDYDKVKYCEIYDTDKIHILIGKNY